MKEKIILIGGGGHCKSCIDIIEAEDKFEIAGIIDVKEKLGQKVLDYEIFAAEDDLDKLTKEFNYFFITVGSVKSSDKREKIYNKIKKYNVILPVIISPGAYVSNRAEIGAGTVIAHGAIINSRVKIGQNCIINTNAVVEHDSVIGSNCHISTGAVVNGENVIGNNVFVGSNSVLVQCIKILDNITIGAGSVVVKSLGKQGTYVGNPAKVLKNE